MKFSMGSNLHFKKFFQVLLPVLFFSILSYGCKYSFMPVLYLGDLVDVVNGEKNLKKIGARISLEVPSKESCLENKGEISKILSTQYENIEDVACKSIGLDSFFEATIDVPIIKVPFTEDSEKVAQAIKENTPSKGVFYFYVYGNKETISVSVFFKKANFEKLNETISNKFMSSIDPEEMTFSIELQNDLQDQATIEVGNAYVNSRPYPLMTSFPLKRRNKMEITFSNVLVRALYESAFLKNLIGIKLE